MTEHPYDCEIRALFLRGNSLIEIAEKLALTKCCVSCRLKQIFPNTYFKLKWRSKLFPKRWRVSHRVLKNPGEVFNAQKRLIKFIKVSKLRVILIKGV